MGLFSSIAKGISSGLDYAGDIGEKILTSVGVPDQVASAATEYDLVGLASKGVGAFGGGGGLPSPPGSMIPGPMYTPQTPGFNPAAGRASGGLPATLPQGGMAVPQGVYYQPIEGQNIKKVFRCMSGYVMVNYPAGTTSKVCMLKNYARTLGLWKPSPKPPISVRDWNSLKRADRVISKLKKVDQRAKKIANYRTPTKRSKQVPAHYTVIDEGSGSANLKMIKAGRK